MNAHECPREPEVFDAIASGAWLTDRHGVLRTHAASCAICADLATVAATIVEARTQSLGSVVVPSAAATWWRAQLRIRRDAIDAVNALIRMAQWVAAVGVAVAILMLILRNWASVAAADPAIGWGLLLPLAVAAATISIATPLALCFVMSSD